MRFRATLAYDGSAYYGFQRQKNARPTIQEQVELALQHISNSEQRAIIHGAGRTDTGVHATGQVIAFDLEWKHTCEQLRSAINANLPDDIAVTQVAVTTVEFHPRFDAKSRRYIYRCYCAEVRDPMRRLQALHLKKMPDVGKMQEAANLLVGTQDYRTFGSPPSGNNAVRTIFEADWQSVNDELHFSIMGNAFLYRMVRRIVGTLLLVGNETITIKEFRDIVASRDSARAGSAVAPHGLTLVAVNYDG